VPVREAENLTILGGAYIEALPANDPTNYSGAYVGILNPGDGIAGYELVNTSIVDQVAVLNVHYAAGGDFSTGDRTISVYTRPDTAPAPGTRISSLIFQETAAQPNAPFGWNVWGDQPVAVSVPAGSTTHVDFVVDGGARDTGVLNIDQVQFVSCEETTNTPPEIVNLTDQTFNSYDNIFEVFDVLDDQDDITSLSVRIVGAPTGVFVGGVNGTTNSYALQGFVGGPGVYPVQIIATDAGNPALTSSVTIELKVDTIASPHVGDVVFNEVLYAADNSTYTGTADFVSLDGSDSSSYDDAEASFQGSTFELRNILSNPTDETNLSGWKLFNYNPAEGPDPASAAAPLNWTFPFNDGFGNDTIVPGGGRIVVTSREISDFAVTFANGERPLDMSTSVLAPTVDQQHGLQPSGGMREFLDPVAGELWLVDDAFRAVSYVAWGTPGTGSLRTSPPNPGLGIWDDASGNQANLAGAGLTQSISLATDGPSSSNSACWEHNGSGTAVANPACTATRLNTIDDDMRELFGPDENWQPGVWDLTDLFQNRDTSIGAPNTSGVIPLPPNSPPPPAP